MFKDVFQNNLCQFINRVLIIVLLITVSACKKDVPTGKINGNIYFAGTKIPVSDVRVQVGKKKSNSTSDGKYHIEGIEVGDYILTAEKNGFDTYSADISISGKATELEIPLTSEKFTSRIYGTLTGELSGPKSGLEIAILNPDGSLSDLKSVSDANGFFEILSVPQGQRELAILQSIEIIFDASFVVGEADFLFDLVFEEDKIPLEMTDTRDGRTYKVLSVGGYSWMAENLSWLPEVSSPDDGSETKPFYYVYGYDGTSITEAKEQFSFNKFGVLYNWEAAKTACPNGWHLPSDQEWKLIEAYYGMSDNEVEVMGWRMSGNVGVQLKSTSGWESEGNGDNTSGFTAFPAGNRRGRGGFTNSGSRAFFWSSTEAISPDAVHRLLNFEMEGVYRGNFGRNAGFTVRCVKDL